MTYVLPENVISPQNYWALTCVIYNEEQGGIAVAFGRWDNNPVIGIRWNGYDEPHKELGNPQSSGNPTWFILPKELGIVIVKELLIKKALGNECIQKENMDFVIAWLKDYVKISHQLY